MSEIVVPSIDVVIPVYNAPVLTKRCIDSVVSYLGESIENIYIHNDASNVETREMLDSLPYSITHIHHSIKNQGFGASVNDAISRSSASYILVLNSDTEMNGNILPPLCAAMSVDSQLAVIIPASNDCIHGDFNRYLRQPGNYIRTYRLRGYAFLIRRSVFQEIGGFDPIFGRGYYEDIDLGRRIYEHNWHIGVHPDSLIYHKGGGSFGRGLAAKIPCLHMKNSPANLLLILKFMMFYGWLRKDKRISDVWLLLPSNSRFLRKLLALLSKVRGIKILTWKK